MRPTLLLCITLLGFVGCTMGRFPEASMALGGVGTNEGLFAHKSANRARKDGHAS